MLLFSVTGITLNHPTVFEGDAEITQIEADVPPAIMAG
ncbi:PepSY-associated TM helix domain-containing protein, partial [Idiomarina sp. UBA3162]